MARIKRANSCNSCNSWPKPSALAAPSAQELAALQDTIRAAGVPAIFVGTTVSPDLANQLASDLGVQVVALYTGSLSDENGPAANYPAFMRYNVEASGARPLTRAKLQRSRASAALPG